MGAGLNASGVALAIAGGDIYVGGEFTAAGCYVSPYFARWADTLWTGSTSTDWHTGANWGGGSVPPPNAGVTISAANATISSADVTVGSLIVTNGRTLAVGAGRTLTVNGNIDLTNGFLTGPGTVVVNGNVNMGGNDITNLNSLTVNGGLSLGTAKITGSGLVTVTSCSTGAVGGGSSTSFIAGPLMRCVGGPGIFKFPVGTGTVYSPFELANVAGTGNVTVEAKAGAYPGSPTGLSTNRLQRWWDVTNAGLTQADVTVTYTDAEVVGREAWYRVFRISGGAATQLVTTLNQSTNRATTTGVTSFGAWTLAEGQPFPLTLSGRVTTASGRGGWGVIVSLDDGQGNIRYTMTNPFGYYRFPNVLTYKSYTLGVQHKKFTFTAPQRTVDFDEFTPVLYFQSTDH